MYSYGGGVVTHPWNFYVHFWFAFRVARISPKVGFWVDRKYLTHLHLKYLLLRRNFFFEKLLSWCLVFIIPCPCCISRSSSAYVVPGTADDFCSPSHTLLLAQVRSFELISRSVHGAIEFEHSLRHNGEWLSDTALCFWGEIINPGTRLKQGTARQNSVRDMSVAL